MLFFPLFTHSHTPLSPFLYPRPIHPTGREKRGGDGLHAGFSFTVESCAYMNYSSRGFLSLMCDLNLRIHLISKGEECQCLWAQTLNFFIAQLTHSPTPHYTTIHHAISRHPHCAMCKTTRSASFWFIYLLAEKK
jgi:hypothetical protein